MKSSSELISLYLICNNVPVDMVLFNDIDEKTIWQSNTELVVEWYQTVLPTDISNMILRILALNEINKLF